MGDESVLEVSRGVELLAETFSGVSVICHPQPPYPYPYTATLTSLSHVTEAGTTLGCDALSTNYTPPLQLDSND